MLLVAVVILTGCAAKAETTEAVAIPESICVDAFRANLSSQNLHLPLEVRVSADLDETSVRATQTAVAYWNETMGAPVFVLSSAPASDTRECGVVRVTGNPKPGYRAWTDWDDCSATVAVKDNDSTLQTRDFVVRHELGHVLNLEHDDVDGLHNLMSEFVLGAKMNVNEKCLVATALTVVDGDDARMAEFR